MEEYAEYLWVDEQGVPEGTEIGKGEKDRLIALGFGEITITRYLAGQIPSKEYSDIIKNALASPNFMKKELRENEAKIANTAFKKAYEAAEEIDNLFEVSEKMLNTISYIFKNMEEVTPLMLQKLLYYTQGINLALYNNKLFPEQCRAWVHGPVYREVYDLFRDFKYNPIEDARFAIFENSDNVLSENEKDIIEVVTNSFGMYSGKTLEKITHMEEPWLKARNGFGEGVPSDELITTASIKKYFKLINEKFDLASENQVIEYIKSVLEQDV